GSLLDSTPRANPRHREAAQVRQQLLDYYAGLAAGVSRVPDRRVPLAMAYDKLGILLMSGDRLPEAETAFRKAVELAPEYAKAHNTLAWLQVSYPEVPQREPGEAVRLAKAAVAMEPEMREFWNTLGVAYYRAGEWTPATEALEKSMQLKDGGGGDAHD